MFTVDRYSTSNRQFLRSMIIRRFAEERDRGSYEYKAIWNNDDWNGERHNVALNSQSIVSRQIIVISRLRDYVPESGRTQFFDFRDWYIRKNCPRDISARDDRFSWL